MFQKFSTMLVLFLTFSMLVFAQDRRVLEPFASTYVSKSGQSPEIIVDQNTKGPTILQNQIVPQPVMVKGIQGTIDTLSYRKTLGGNWNTNFGAFAQDLLIQWYVAPADLTIKAIGGTFSDNANGTDGSFKIYKVGNGITLDDLKNVGPGAVKQGNFKALDPNYILGFVGFEDESDGTGYNNVGNLSAFPFAEDIWSDVGFGYPLTPVVSTSDAPVYQYVETINFGFEPEVLRGEIFAIVFKNESNTLGQATGDDRIGFWSLGTAGNPDFYGWKFYAQGRTDGDATTAYWYSREYVWDMAAIVDLTGDRPPVISNVLTLGTTLSNADRSVTANIVDDNPSGSTPGGVSAAVLQWSIDGGTTWNDAAMTGAGDVYTGSIPGQPAGTTVRYKVMATDDNTNSSESPVQSYFIFQKQKDVLFIYNNNEFSTNTARRLYIGGSTNTPYIIDPVDNDIWTSADGTAEAADVMSLYNWIVQVDGSFPDADFSDAAKTYLDGATAGNERNYFLSSQDYGCFLNGTCADITFAAGDFQYDYLGVSLLGPQDLSGAIVGLEGVSGDPLSGWVAQYVTDNSGVGFYYDPGFELGFTSYIDALTPGNGGVAAYTSDGAVVGVHNEGANWKTAFLTYDYAAANFRSDTSVADHSDAGYAWGITVGNQVRAFLEWAGYVTGIEPIQGALPTAYSLDQNYPNPFNPTTSIRFSIPQAGNVSLAIYDVLGRKVADLVNSYQQAGSFNATWDGTNQFGAKVTSGTYFYQLKTDNGFIQTKKMVLLK